MALPRTHRAWLEYVSNGAMNGFDCMFSTDRYRKDVAELLVLRGMLSHLKAVVCDEPGSIKGDQERERIGYALTEKGELLLAGEAGS